MPRLGSKIGASPAVIRIIKYGVLLPWTGQPRLGVRRENPLNPEDHEFPTQEMDRWITQGYAVRRRPRVRDLISINIFVVVPAYEISTMRLRSN
jgi:hypothetical protein